MPDEPNARKRGILAGLRSSFLTGLIVVLPVGLTVYLIWTVIVSIRGVGVIVFLIFTVLIGWVAKGLIGRSIIRTAERMVDRMPVVRSIYNGLKQIAETVFAQSETNFDKACLVQFPRAGIWAIGFVSTKARGEIARRIPVEGDVLTVFVATTPNPTSGFLVYVPARDVILLDMSIEDAAKMIISAGLVYPNPRDPSQPPAASAP